MVSGSASEGIGRLLLPAHAVVTRRFRFRGSFLSERVSATRRFPVAPPFRFARRRRGSLRHLQDRPDPQDERGNGMAADRRQEERPRDPEQSVADDRGCGAEAWGDGRDHRHTTSPTEGEPASQDPSQQPDRQRQQQTKDDRHQGGRSPATGNGGEEQGPLPGSPSGDRVLAIEGDIPIRGPGEGDEAGDPGKPAFGPPKFQLQIRDSSR